MRIGVVSDTHGHGHNTLNAAQRLLAVGVERVIHCGDIGSPEIPPLFRHWPTDFVLGNVDRDEPSLREAMDAPGHKCHGRFGSFEVAGCRIAVLHGDDSRRLRETIDSGQWDLVCCGHTHRPETYRVGRTRVLNPGALFRARIHTIAIVTVPDLEIQSVEL